MRFAAALGCTAVLAAACGAGRRESIPPACTQGPETVVAALAKAPAPVTIGGTPISRCFNRGASGDDVQIVGTILLSAAQQLADRGQALQLGYLVGAARRGARRNGLGTEIARRLEAETSDLGSDRAAYRRGLRAGLAQG